MCRLIRATAVTIAVSLFVVAPVTAGDSDFDVSPSKNREGIVANLQGREDGAAERSENGSSPVRRLTTTRKQVFYARRPVVGTLEDGRPCLTVVRRRVASAAEAQAIEDQGNIVWQYQYANYPGCPSEPRAPAATSAAAIAEEFWRVQLRDLLDKPKPSIAPGYMLAGKLGYLETNARMVQRFTHDTPLGLLRIEARGRLFVDWGDGTGVAGPYSDPGKPWPDGTITHSWTDAARYDVVVTQRWTATWELAGRTGSFDGLITVGRIEDFEVRQLQAVRNR